MNKINDYMSPNSIYPLRKLTYILGIFLTLVFLSFQQSCKKEEECIAPELDSITLVGSLISIDSLIPTRKITLHGKHLNEVTKISLNSLSYDASYLYHPDTTITFTVPYVKSNITIPDTLSIFKSCGSARLLVSIMAAPAFIKSISNEFAVPDEVITLQGFYFSNLQHVWFPDSIQGEIVAGYNDSVCQVIVPEGVTTQGKILLTSPSGISNSGYNIEFHDTTGLICNFDDLNTWLDWGGDVIQNSDDITIPPANGYFFLSDLTNIAPGSGEIENSILPLTINEIPDYEGSLGPSYFAFQAEIYLLNPWKCGYYKILIGAMNDADELEYSYEYKYQPWSDSVNYEGVFSTEGWETVKIPLTKFQLSGSSTVYLQSYSQLRMINYMQWSFVNPSVEEGGKPISHFKMAIDNIRLAQIIDN
jgi:hypothetical protein